MVRQEWELVGAKNVTMEPDSRAENGRHLPVGVLCDVSIDSGKQSVSAANWSSGSSREMVKQSRRRAKFTSSGTLSAIAG